MFTAKNSGDSKPRAEVDPAKLPKEKTVEPESKQEPPPSEPKKKPLVIKSFAELQQILEQDGGGAAPSSTGRTH